MRLLGALALAACGVTHAGELLAPDDEVAHREYSAGVYAYEMGDYETALRKFRVAKEARPVPALDYDIARCLDRLGRWPEAADAYEHYLEKDPLSDKTIELRARIVDLRQRKLEPIVAPRAPERRPRARLAAGLVLGGALGAGGAGGAVYGSAYADYASRRDACNSRCAPSTLDGLASEVRTREIASGVLWGVAGVALVADIVPWIKAAKRAAPVQARADGAVFSF